MWEAPRVGGRGLRGKVVVALMGGWFECEWRDSCSRSLSQSQSVSVVARQRLGDFLEREAAPSLALVLLVPSCLGLGLVRRLFLPRVPTSWLPSPSQYSVVGTWKAR